jgi:hypothetical protein
MGLLTGVIIGFGLGVLMLLNRIVDAINGSRRVIEQALAMLGKMDARVVLMSNDRSQRDPRQRIPRLNGHLILRYESPGK